MCFDILVILSNIIRKENMDHIKSLEHIKRCTLKKEKKMKIDFWPTGLLTHDPKTIFIDHFLGRPDHATSITKKKYVFGRPIKSELGYLSTWSSSLSLFVSFSNIETLNFILLGLEFLLINR